MVKIRMIATVHPGDVVRVGPDDWSNISNTLLLRIGAPKQGQSRLAVLTPSQARRLAINLLRGIDELEREAT